MKKANNPPEEVPTLTEMMKLVEKNHLMGVNFHMYKRKRIPSFMEIGSVTDEGWQALKQELLADFPWDRDCEVNITLQRGMPKPMIINCIHLPNGVTVHRNDDGWIVLVYDHDCESIHIEDLKCRIKKVCKQNSKHEIGFIQASGSHLYVRFCQYKPYENDLIAYMDDSVIRFREQMLHHLNKENGNGLYLLHGKPGTGKTSFIKSILSQTGRKGIFLSPAMTDKLSSPEFVALLMDNPDSILVIEDAETTLMKRAADNSSAVSNLLNMSDGFPADFLNLCILCTFNTELDNIDPALLRRGRLRGMLEFKPLNEEQARKIAGVIGVSREIGQPVTIAELCNSTNDVVDFQSRKVGF